MIKEIQKKNEIGIEKKQDILENQAKTVFLALGSNIGDRRLNIEKTKYLINDRYTKIVKSSNFYETNSWPNNNFPKFYNIIIQIKTFLDPIPLFEKIKLIEKKIGRIKTLKNYPRVCDIDIIDYNNEVVFYKKDFNLEIPHPRMEKRNFVLIPLYELTKTWKHPKLNKNICNLISNLSINDLRSIKII